MLVTNEIVSFRYKRPRLYLVRTVVNFLSRRWPKQVRRIILSLVIRRPWLNIPLDLSCTDAYRRLILLVARTPIPTLRFNIIRYILVGLLISLSNTFVTPPRLISKLPGYPSFMFEIFRPCNVRTIVSLIIRSRFLNRCTLFLTWSIRSQQRPLVNGSIYPWFCSLWLVARSLVSTRNGVVRFCLTVCKVLVPAELTELKIRVG